MQYGAVGTDPVLNKPCHLCRVEAPHSAAIRDNVLPSSAAEDPPAYCADSEGALAARHNSVMESLVEGVLNGVGLPHLIQ